MSCLAIVDCYPASDLTPSGVSEESTHLREQREQNWNHQSSDAHIKAAIAETINEILQLQELEDDWDLDGAQPVDPLAIGLAARFVHTVGETIRQEGLSWEVPSVGPVADGSVALTWNAGARQALAIFRPSQLALVVCVTREVGSRPIRQVLSARDAIRRVVWALCGRG